MADLVDFDMDESRGSNDVSSPDSDQTIAPASALRSEDTSPSPSQKALDALLFVCDFLQKQAPDLASLEEGLAIGRLLQKMEDRIRSELEQQKQR